MWAIIRFVPSLCLGDHSFAPQIPHLRNTFLKNHNHGHRYAEGSCSGSFIYFTHSNKPRYEGHCHCLTPVVLKTFKKTWGSQTVSEFTCFSGYHWNSLNGNWKGSLLQISETSLFFLFYCQVALLTNVPICHCLSKPFSDWLKVFD